jgi:peroxiredoxin Q/BCP
VTQTPETGDFEPGDKAPAFSLPTTGKPAKLADFAGKTLALFFYPQDDTETCTKEAMAFSAMQSQYARKGVALLGVSPDPLEAHVKFIAKYDLKLRLGSDEDLKVTKAYRCWGRKKLYGREYMGVIRSTFVIGPDGLVRGVWRNVRVKGHAEAVLELAASI